MFRSGIWQSRGLEKNKVLSPATLQITAHAAFLHSQRNISPLSAAHFICPGNSHQSSSLPFIYHQRQIAAWLCLNYTTNSADISTYILTLHASSLEILTKLTSKRSSLTFISTYPVQPEDWIHSITATPNSKMPTKPTHCRRLENQTTRPSFSLRIINNEFFKNPRWRGKWRAGPPTLKLRYRRLLMTSTGTCSGRVHLTSANSRR